MKNKNILVLIGLGIIVWYFLKQKKVLTGGVKLGEAIPPFPSPGLYFAQLSPLTTVTPAVVSPEEAKKEEVIVPKSIADIMESVVSRAKVEI